MEFDTSGLSAFAWCAACGTRALVHSGHTGSSSCACRVVNVQVRAPGQWERSRWVQDQLAEQAIPTLSWPNETAVTGDGAFIRDRYGITTNPPVVAEEASDGSFHCGRCGGIRIPSSTNCPCIGVGGMMFGHYSEEHRLAWDRREERLREASSMQPREVQTLRLDAPEDDLPIPF